MAGRPSGRPSHGSPDLVILDLGLPDLDGVKVIEELRAWSQMPIIVLSGRGGSQDEVDAFNAGADDYVVKPFGMDELIARVRAVIRRAPNSDPPPVVQVGAYRVDLARKTIVGPRYEPVHLTPIEWGILEPLLRSPRTAHRAATTPHRRLGFRPRRGHQLSAHLHGLAAPQTGGRSRPGPVTSSPSPAWATASSRDRLQRQTLRFQNDQADVLGRISRLWPGQR